MVNYEQILSARVKEVQPSGIRRFFELAAKMPHAISLGVGEPDFETPWQIRRAGIQSLEKGQTFYTSNWGLAELRNQHCRARAPQVPPVLRCGQGDPCDGRRLRGDRQHHPRDCQRG